jgi:hypothetical protein
MVQSFLNFLLGGMGPLGFVMASPSEDGEMCATGPLFFAVVIAGVVTLLVASVTVSSSSLALTIKALALRLRGYDNDRVLVPHSGGTIPWAYWARGVPLGRAFRSLKTQMVPAQPILIDDQDDPEASKE